MTVAQRTRSLRDPFIDLADQDFNQDPYPHYHAVRAHARVYFSEAQNLWFVSGYEEVQRALRDRRFGSLGNTVRDAAMDRPPPSARFLRMYHRWLLTRDDEMHTRLRVLMTKAFTPKAVNAFTPRIGEIVDEILTPLLTRREIEVVEQLGYPLPLRVISELIGIPRDDQDMLHAHVLAGTPLLEPSITEAKLRAAEAAAERAEDYLLALVERRRASPEHGILDALIAAEEAGDRLSTEEIAANVLLLFGAGHETVANLLGLGLYALLRHPEQLARLVAQPASIPNGVEELLRFDTSAQLIRRGTYEEVDLFGVTIPKGAFVVLGVGAANRDPARYRDPDVLDVTREEIRPLSFGHGMHSCLGAHLARVELGVVLTRLLTRAPNLRLLETPRYRTLVNLRGLEALHVSL